MDGRDYSKKPGTSGFVLGKPPFAPVRPAFDQEFNLEANLMDLSRISLGGQLNDQSIILEEKDADEMMIQEPPLFLESVVIPEPVFSQQRGGKPATGAQAQLADCKPSFVNICENPAQSKPPAILKEQNKAEAAQAEAARAPAEWKKVSINKKKRFAKRQDTEVATNMVSVPTSSYATPLIAAKDGPAKKAIMRRAESNNKYAIEAEPLPLFDCLYCIGIHEHLALQTLKEKQLTIKYGGEPNLKQDATDQTYAEFNAEFDANVRHLTRFLTVQALEYEVLRKTGRLDEREGSGLASVRSAAEEKSLNTKADLRDALVLAGNERYKPLGAKIALRMKQIQKARALQAPPTRPQIKPAPHQMDSLNSNDSFDSQLASNILGGFNEIDSDDQSMFINLNIRNRRQKILHNISFESEFYDIFNPEFSSEGDSELTDSKSSGQTSEEAAETSSSELSNSKSYDSNENSLTSSQASSRSQNSFQLSGGKGLLKVPTNVWAGSQLDVKSISRANETESRFPDLDASQAPDRTIELNKQSKTNQTKLKEHDLDYNSENNQSSLSSIHREIQEAPIDEPKTRNNRLDSDNNGETGGCQVEEMQDDTVVNRCNYMLAEGKGDANESFTVHVQRVQKVQLGADPLNDESLNSNQEEEKRGTGHFNSKAGYGSLKFTEKKQELGSAPLQLDEEDNSIIKILPGLPGCTQFKPFGFHSEPMVAESSHKDGDTLGDASSLSSAGAVAGLYHHGINLILQTSAGAHAADHQVAPQDTDEDEADELLSPILKNNFIDPKPTFPNFKTGKVVRQKKSKMHSPRESAHLRAEQTSPNKKAKVARTVNVSGGGTAMAGNLKSSTQKMSTNTRNNFNATVSNSQNLIGTKPNQNYLQKTQQAANLRKTTLMIGAENEANPVSTDFYSQMGKAQKKRGSVQSKNSRGNSQKKLTKMPSSLHNHMISASMGTLPGLYNPSMIKTQGESKAALLKCESLTVLEHQHLQLQTADVMRRKQQLTTTKSKSKLLMIEAGGEQVPLERVLQTSVTPVKTKVPQNQALGAPGRASVIQNQKSYNRHGKSEKQTSGKHARQMAQTNIGETSKPIDPHTGQKGNYGMLSKQQLKLMKQLEKQQSQQNPAIIETKTLAFAKKNENTKIVMDNYFKINQDEHLRTQGFKNFQTASVAIKVQTTKSKPEQVQKRISAVHSPNQQQIQSLQRYISQNKNQIQTQQQQWDNLAKYRSSVIESHLQTVTDKALNTRKSNENLTHLPTEKIQLSVSPTHKSKQLAVHKQKIPNLNLKAVADDQIEIQDQQTTKYQKFQSVKPQPNDSLTQISKKSSHYNTKIQSQAGQNDSKHLATTVLHLSSSHIDPKNSVTHVEISKKREQAESNIFNEDNTNFTIPAQSQRTRVSVNKLSISADKTPKPQNKELLKSTIELGANNFSQIQAIGDKTTGGVYSCIENNPHRKKSSNPSATIYSSSNTKQMESSKQSIEREATTTNKQVKIFKIQKQDLKKDSKLIGRDSGLQFGIQGNTVSQPYQSKLLAAQQMEGVVHHTTALKARRKESQVVVTQNSSDLASSSKNNESGQDQLQHLPNTSSKVFDYKKLILENDQKLQRYQQLQKTGGIRPAKMTFLQSQLKRKQQ